MHSQSYWNNYFNSDRYFNSGCDVKLILKFNLNHYWNNYFKSDRYFNSGCNKAIVFSFFSCWIHGQKYILKNIYHCLRSLAHCKIHLLWWHGVLQFMIILPEICSQHCLYINDMETLSANEIRFLFTAHSNINVSSMARRTLGMLHSALNSS